MTTPEVRETQDARDPSTDEKAVLTVLEGIGPLDSDAMAAAEALLDRLTKPPGSLGRLESLVVQLAGITGRSDAPVVRRAIVVAAGDHGVTRHGVSAYPSDVTAQMLANFVAGGAAINVLAAEVGATVVVVDVGVAGPIPAADRDATRGGRLVEARIREGTADMTEGPAMSRAEALGSIRVGLDLVADLRNGGLDLVGLGEMGIGNTTAASAITAVLTGRPAGRVTGRGTGVDADGHRRKVAAIKRAIEVNRPNASDPIGVLATVGGLEIGVLVGVIVGAAAAGIPVVLDGFITGSAALIAAALQPAVVPRLIAGHRSPEPGHAVILDHLGLAPVLDLELRLGEGSGAALAMGLVSAAVAIRDRMATFESAAVSAAVLDSVDATRPA
jgi:nicotinate-nucleotide--dimethylbenzimidazole phosphoribosyltransferase